MTDTLSVRNQIAQALAYTAAERAHRVEVGNLTSEQEAKLAADAIMPVIADALAAAAERDALRATVDRVRALHLRRRNPRIGSLLGSDRCTTCSTAWPCPTVRALDGTAQDEPRPATLCNCWSSSIGSGRPVWVGCPVHDPAAQGEPLTDPAYDCCCYSCNQSPCPECRMHGGTPADPRPETQR